MDYAREPATPATYGLRCGLRISVPATPEPRDYRKSAPPNLYR